MMGVVIGIVAIKGGVGKTSVSASLATALAHEYGKKVLVVDGNYGAPNLGIHLDVIAPERTIHHVLAGKMRMRSAIHRRHGVDVIPGSYVWERELPYLKLKDKLQGIKANYDFVIVDGSPSLNEEILSTMLAVDYLLMVSTPDYPTLSCSLRAVKLARQRGKKFLGIVLNRVLGKKYELSLEEIESAVGVPVIARIPEEGKQGEALALHVPLSAYHRNNGFSREIRALAGVFSGEERKQGVLSRILSGDKRKEIVNREILKERFYTPHFSV